MGKPISDKIKERFRKFCAKRFANKIAKFVHELLRAEFPNAIDITTCH